MPSRSAAEAFGRNTRIRTLNLTDISRLLYRCAIFRWGVGLRQDNLQHGSDEKLYACLSHMVVADRFELPLPAYQTGFLPLKDATILVPVEGNAPTSVLGRRIYSPPRLFNGIHRHVWLRSREIKLMRLARKPFLSAVLVSEQGFEP